jgi:DNA-directed RNA polymerase specialized sigma24 family protein
MELKPSQSKPEAQPGSGRGRWLLGRPALQGLLSLLDADEVRAAQHYERLRDKLIVFFSGRRCAEPEDRADETLDRIGRRIEEGEQIADVTRYAYGVARLVAMESVKRVRRRTHLLARLASSSDAGRGDDFAGANASDAMACIRRCRDRLPPEDQDLILRYYDSAGRDQHAERRQLAAGLDLSPAALRLRAFRIRRVLEACTRDCLGLQTERKP